MADLLNIGSTGLLAFQRSIATTSHNISNSTTEGYTRQRVELSAQTPFFNGSGFEGAGVSVSSVKRLYDEYINSEVTSNLSSYKQQETLSELASQLDGFLADPNVGVSPVLQDFFKALQDVSTDPSSTSSRQVVLSQAETLASVMNDTVTRLDTLSSGVNFDINSNIEEINSLARAIADVNEDILSAGGSSAAFQPNDLLDQREVLVKKLSEFVDLNTIIQDNGGMNVFIGKGQALVVGAQYQQLGTLSSEFDATRLEVGLVAGNTINNISSQITGGKLGALLTFRTDMLDPAYQEIGRVALTLAVDVNAQHQNGMDLNGELGGNFFSDITSTGIINSAQNNVATNLDVTVDVTDSTLIHASEYLLSYDGTNYSLRRQLDDVLVGTAASIAALSTAVSPTEGFTLTLNGGSATAGDKFIISTVRTAAKDIDVVVTQTDKLALASPLRMSRSATNTGTALISSDQLISRIGNTLPAAPITFTFDGTNAYDIAIGGVPTGGSIAYNPATDSGTTYQYTVAGLGDYEFTIKGTPATGDVFTLDVNTNGIGDNRNALSLIGLQQQKRVANSSANYQDAYAQLVSSIGSQTQSANFSRDVSEALYNRSIEARESISGVNLDEEAADLIRYQQAYTAVARIITTADELFDTLLNAVR